MIKNFEKKDLGSVNNNIKGIYQLIANTGKQWLPVKASIKLARASFDKNILLASFYIWRSPYSIME